MNYFLHSEGLLPCPEPFRQLLVQGVVMGKTYKVQSTGKYVPESEVVQEEDKCTTKHGESVVVSWEKMSKSKHNGIDPLNLLNKYGVDTTRLLILADVAPTSTRNWSEDSTLDTDFLKRRQFVRTFVSIYFCLFLQLFPV